MADYNADVSPVVDHLREIQHTTGHRLGRVFRDWMALAVFAFERNDDEYLERLDRYDRVSDEDTKREVADAFSRALGELVILTSEADRPVVGDVYEQVGNQADEFGQYFTPWHVSLAIAQINFADEDGSDATVANPLTIADPACGSGRMLVAAAKTMHDRNPETPVFVRGTDKDRTCARMAVVNLVIAGVPGVIRCGDSLTLEIHRAWEVEPTGPGPAVRRLDPEDVTPNVRDETDQSASTTSETSDEAVAMDFMRWS